jgi:hypothetical protein
VPASGFAGAEAIVGDIGMPSSIVVLTDRDAMLASEHELNGLHNELVRRASPRFIVACVRRPVDSTFVRGWLGCALVGLAGLVGACGGDVPAQDEKLRQDDAFAFTTRDRVHAFYSGHSLTDGVPEAVAAVAAARGQTLEFEFQTAPYSLLRSRTKGSVQSPTWDGYRTGQNRHGGGLDVAQELLTPSRLSPGQRYDALIVTERHDLPWVAATEGTATYLADFAKRLWAGNPAGDVFFYHTWLAIDLADPRLWIQYERRAQRLWECVASRANRELGEPTNRIRVIPGGAPLAELVERLWDGHVPGITETHPSARVRLVFTDDVHLSALGTYYIGLVHYAVLFGQAPTGSRLAGVSAETSEFLEQLAQESVASYARVAVPASRRSLDACRVFAADMCDASYRLPARGWRNWLLGLYRSRKCARIYADRSASWNPFRGD